MKQMLCLAALLGAAPEEYTVHTFKKIILTEKFFSEGATWGDFNKDGKPDVVAGPFWYEGPDFTKAHEYYKPVEFNKERYSDNFFAFTHDFNKDGWADILIYGFPGLDASWFENPQGKDGHWKRTKVFNVVDNESPTFTDITGDGTPEIVCSSGGFLCYVTIDDWKMHAISPQDKRYHKFTHGLGVGDVNGDGRMDLLEASGWWEQPSDLKGDPVWKKHEAQLGRTPAQMYVYDLDGDGDNDVLATIEAHGYGFAWFEQVKEGDKIAFKTHTIMGKTPGENKYGLKLSQMHAVDFIDMDGDGVKDIVTGKRHFAHGSKGDAEPGSPPVLYWFRIVRTPQGPDFVPYKIDDDSGVGVQVVAVDMNGDKLPDIVVGSKRGAFVLLHELRKVSKEEWESAQPKAIAK